jgi:hypothetical protein
MSARIDMEPVSWHPLRPTQAETTKNISDMDLQSFTNFDPAETMPPSSALQGKPARKPDARAAREPKQQECGRPGHPEDPGVKVEQLLSDIKRGEECLQQLQRELVSLRADLEAWPEYERVCGTNPLAGYLQAISTKEQLVNFLPGWLKRQQEQLQSLSRTMESGGAKQMEG